MKKTRIEYIDIFKCLAILMVIVGHINFANQGVKTYIYSYHMPLFFFIYGVITIFKFEKEDYQYNLRKSIFSKFVSILIPYFLWALLFCEFTPKNLFYVFYGSHQALNINSNSSLWFLPCYFISTLLFEILFCFIQKRSKKDPKWFYIFSLFFTLLFISFSYFFPIQLSLGIPFSIQVSFMGVAFMLIGSMMKSFISQLDLSHPLWVLLILLLLFSGTFLTYFNNVNYVLMAENHYGDLYLFLVPAIFGCLFILGLSYLLAYFIPSTFKKLCLFLGQNTLVIFAVHKPVISLMSIVFAKFPLPSFFMLFITLIACLIFSSFAVLFINHFVPALNGKKSY